MKLLIRIPPTPRGCGFPAHVNEDGIDSYEYLEKLYCECSGEYPYDWRTDGSGKSLWQEVKNFIMQDLM